MGIPPFNLCIYYFIVVLQKRVCCPFGAMCRTKLVLGAAIDKEGSSDRLHISLFLSSHK